MQIYTAMQRQNIAIRVIQILFIECTDYTDFHSESTERSSDMLRCRDADIQHKEIHKIYTVDIIQTHTEHTVHTVQIPHGVHTNPHTLAIHHNTHKYTQAQNIPTRQLLPQPTS